MQRVRPWLVFGLPALLVGVGIWFYTSRLRPSGPPPRELTKAEIAAKLLPELKDLKVDSVHDVDLLNLRVEKSPMMAKGAVRNRTNRQLRNVDVMLAMLDRGGSLRGSVTARITNIAPGETTPFSVPLADPKVASLLLREILFQ